MRGASGGRERQWPGKGEGDAAPGEEDTRRGTHAWGKVSINLIRMTVNWALTLTGKVVYNEGAREVRAVFISPTIRRCFANVPTL